MGDVPGDLVEAQLRVAVVGGQPQVQLGAVRVGLSGVHRPIGVMDREDPVAGIVHGSADRGGRTGQAPGLPQRHPVVDEGVGRRAKALALTDGSDRIGVAEPSAEAVERVDGRRPADAVDPETGVALELLAGVHGVRTEDAVHPPGIEAEASEPALELGDVLAPHHRRLQVEESVAERVPLLDEGPPGLGTADAVGVEAVLGLERDDGALRPVGEGAVVDSRIETGGPQT